MEPPLPKEKVAFSLVFVVDEPNAKLEVVAGAEEPLLELFKKSKFGLSLVVSVSPVDDLNPPKPANMLGPS